MSKHMLGAWKGVKNAVAKKDKDTIRAAKEVIKDHKKEKEEQKIIKGELIMDQKWIKIKDILYLIGFIGAILFIYFKNQTDHLEKIRDNQENNTKLSTQLTSIDSTLKDIKTSVSKTHTYITKDVVNFQIETAKINTKLESEILHNSKKINKMDKKIDKILYKRRR